MSEPVVPSIEAETSAVPETPAASTGPIVAVAGRYYRNARFIMVLGLLIMGGYFAYDGYVGWPKLNEEIRKVGEAINQTPTGSEEWIRLDQQRTKLGSEKSDTSIGLQKVLGYALPIGAVVYLIYFLRKSRGEIRLENEVLTVPGHPPVRLDQITAIDTKLWKKKGIATLKYTVDGKNGAIVLDDFVYQQTPTDKIYDRIVAHATAQSA